MPASLLTPEVAFAVLALAIAGLLLELAVPGVGVGAVLGLALAVMGVLALAALDARPAGVVLAALSAGLLAMGLFVRPLVLQALGVLALAAAGATLFEQVVHPVVLVLVVAGIGAGGVLLARVVERTRGAPEFTGQAGTLVGQRGEVREGGPAGERIRVHVAGALWTARAPVPLTRGDRVVVTARDDLELRVEPRKTPLA